MSRLTEAVAASYSDLTPQEQRVADVIRVRADEVGLYNSTELAQLAGVSKATVSRLFRRLGFSGSQEVRESLRAQRASGVPVRTGAEPAAGSSLQAQLAADAAALRRLAETIDAAAVERMVGALAEADRVVVLGQRSGYPLALLARQQLAQARPGVRIAPEPGQSVGEELEELTERDVVLLLGIRRRPGGFAQLLDEVAASPARAFLLTDPSGIRFSGRLDETVVCPIDTAFPFDSAAALASVLGAIANGVHAALGEASEARAESIARRYSRLREVENR